MKRIFWASMVLMVFPSAAWAQDMATEHTQILNNIELIAENLRQLQSLYNQVEMIKNQVEGLKSVATYQNNFSDIDALRNNLTNITSQGTALSNQTQAILTQMQQEINNLPVNGTMADRENSLDQSTMNVLQNSITRVTQERQNYQQETDAVNALMAKSDQAVGETQALQTSNQIAAQTIAQMQSTRELLSENIIVQAVGTMREIRERQDMINTMDQMLQPDGDSGAGVNAGEPAMNSTVMTIFNQLTGQYSGSISAIQSGSIALGKELFNAIALLSVGLLGINRLLRKDVDMVESNIELIRWLIYLNIFYLFLTQYDQFLPSIINSFQQAGAYLGGQVSGSYAVPTPSGIISNGFAISLKILTIDMKQTMFLNLGMVLVSVVAIVVILYCFGMIAVELLLLQIGSQIILAGGVFLLAFCGLQWTRDYAERYVHTFFQVGIKMLFMYVIIGIGAGLTNNWAQTLDNIPLNLTLQYNFAVVMATFVFYMLCQKLPEQATVYFTGRFPMGFNAVPSLPDVIKGSVSLGKKAQEFATGMKAGVQGNAKASAAARQAATASFAAQGKTPTPQDIQKEAIRTLGEAKKEMKQEAWDKKVDDTDGGKLAKTILDGIPSAGESPKGAHHES